MVDGFSCHGSHLLSPLIRSIIDENTWKQHLINNQIIPKDAPLFFLRYSNNAFQYLLAYLYSGTGSLELVGIKMYTLSYWRESGWSLLSLWYGTVSRDNVGYNDDCFAKHVRCVLPFKETSTKLPTFLCKRIQMTIASPSHFTHSRHVLIVLWHTCWERLSKTHYCCWGDKKSGTDMVSLPRCDSLFTLELYARL